MEKKFDFKTIAIACLLFFGFVFLLFYKFSSADDSINHYRTATEIFSSQQSYEDFRGSLPEHIIPEWYSDSESMANLLDSIAAFAMGDYIQVADNIVSELTGQITGDPDFLTHFLFDYDSLSWVFDSGTSDFIKTQLEPHIFNEPSVTIGYWVPIPVTVHIGPGAPSSWVGTANTYRNIGSVNCFLARYDSTGWVVAYRGEEQSGNDFGYTFAGNPSFNCQFHYVGSVASGYYHNSQGWSYSDLTSYSSLDSALADFFGNELSDEPTLVSGVSIRNDDFFVKPLSFPSSVMVDYPNEITYPDYDSDDTRLNFEYTYNMEVPFWLKNPTSEITSYELPTDFDFGNIEFEFDADPSYLAGAGIVQDVFEVLPSSLQGLILLFGAGSLAFIFLRR